MGIIGSIASLIGLFLAIVFFFAAQKSPNLVYSIHPTKNVLLRADIPSDLSVLYKGEAIKDKDIVAISLSIWNDGSQSIRPSSILESVKIEFTPRVNILEANVTKLSRAVTKLSLSQDQNVLNGGVVPLEWNILESGDGANIQVIYAGSLEATVSVKGVIEGQGIPRLLSGISIKQDKDSPLNDVKVLKWIIPSILIFSVAITVLSFKYPNRFKFIPFVSLIAGHKEMSWIPLLIAIIPFLIAAVYVFVKLDEWYPPFGF
ncbi:hypothetical protein [uncultured Gilvimarinus sp.]|uniref:hypothetical protein n=1 Tax=uncultured Gilvimarinus sp. TaxID=1689143 RepID=UPI0030EB9951